MTTMAMPASSPPPMSRRFSEVSTSKPSPPAPIIEAMMTMLSDSMMTWFTPTIRLGMAERTMTFHIIWRGVQPAMRPKSVTSPGTWRNASMVTRTMGGMA